MNSSGGDRYPIEILLVEDNPGDVDLTKEALERTKVSNRLHVVEDGEQAIDFLSKRGVYADAPRPDLILLDLNLPKRDGREVLQEIKADPRLTEIPVVVLTTSQADEDVCRAYRLHANCYITKPVNFRQFLKVVQAIEDFWLTVVKLPKKMPRP
jgi:two-component system, chemotaxis family, response regulator Rcp1